VLELEKGRSAYFNFYNHQRPHQSLDYQIPADVYFGTVVLDPLRYPENELNVAIS
jgi:putative transposase